MTAVASPAAHRGRDEVVGASWGAVMSPPKGSHLSRARTGPYRRADRGTRQGRVLRTASPADGWSCALYLFGWGLTGPILRGTLSAGRWTRPIVSV